MKKHFQVEVAYATPEHQLIIAVKVPEGCTALEAVEQSGIAERFDLRFLRDVDAPVGEDEEIEIGRDELDLLPLEGDRADLGEAAVQTLSLALDPFPRHRDADRILGEKGVLSEEAAGPFAALAKLRGKPGG